MMADCLHACLAEVHLDHYHHNFQRYGLSRCDALVNLQMHDYAKFGITSMADRVRLFKLIQSMKSTQAEGVFCQHDVTGSGNVMQTLQPAAVMQKVDEVLKAQRIPHSAMAPMKHEQVISKTSKSTGAAKPGKSKTRAAASVEFNPSTDLPNFKCRKALNFDDSQLDTSVLDTPSDEELPTKSRTPFAVAKPADKQMSVDKADSTGAIKSAAIHCSPSLAKPSERPSPAKPPESIPSTVAVATVKPPEASLTSQKPVHNLDSNSKSVSSVSKFPPGYYYVQAGFSSSLPHPSSSLHNEGLRYSNSMGQLTMPVDSGIRSAMQFPSRVQIQPDAHITSHAQDPPSQPVYNPHLYSQPSSDVHISSVKSTSHQHPVTQPFGANQVTDPVSKYGMSLMYDQFGGDPIVLPSSGNKVNTSAVVHTKVSSQESAQLFASSMHTAPSLSKPTAESAVTEDFVSPVKECGMAVDLASALVSSASQGHSDSGIASPYSREASAEKSTEHAGFHIRTPRDFSGLPDSFSLGSLMSQTSGGSQNTGIVIDKRVEVAQNRMQASHKQTKDSCVLQTTKTYVSPHELKSNKRPATNSVRKSDVTSGTHQTSHPTKLSPHLSNPSPLDTADIHLTMSSRDSSVARQATDSANSDTLPVAKTTLSSSQHSHSSSHKQSDVPSSNSSYFHHHSREDSYTTTPVLTESDYLVHKEIVHSVGYNYGIPITSHHSPLRSRTLNSGQEQQKKLISAQVESSKPSSLNDPIRVCVRKRPLNKRELRKKEASIVSVQGDRIIQVKERKSSFHMSKYSQQHLYMFDEVFDDCCTNQMMYERTAKPLVQHTLSGGSSTCFAFGQTGAGKTFTLLGSRSVPGLYMMAGRDLCRKLRAGHPEAQLRLWLSYYEIYCGHLYDLLNNRKRLYVRENARHQVCIAGLMETQVTEPSQLTQAVEYGNSCRSTGSTGVNVTSSRSHAILQLEIRNSREKKIGRLSFIDLAGSERAADVTDYDRTTRREGAEINQSLLALKECIRALDQAAPYTPYRQSKLTHILRDSFVGNSRTCMIANISPAQSACEHTLNTLNYANRVKDMGQPPTVSEITTPKQRKNMIPPSLFHPSAITLSSTPKGKPPDDSPLPAASPALNDASETPIRGHQLHKWHPSTRDKQQTTPEKKAVTQEQQLSADKQRPLPPSVLVGDKNDLGSGDISGVERMTGGVASVEKVGSNVVFDPLTRRYIMCGEHHNSGTTNIAGGIQGVMSQPPEKVLGQLNSQPLEKKVEPKQASPAAVESLQFDGVFSPIPSPSSTDLAILSQHSPMVQPRVGPDLVNIGTGAAKTTSRRALFQSPKNSSPTVVDSKNESETKMKSKSLSSSIVRKDSNQYDENYNGSSQADPVIATHHHVSDVQRKADHISNISTNSQASDMDSYHQLPLSSHHSSGGSSITKTQAQHLMPQVSSHLTTLASSHISPGHGVSTTNPQPVTLPSQSPTHSAPSHPPAGNESLLVEHQAIMGHLDDILYKVKGVISRNASVNEKTVQEVASLHLEVQQRLSESTEKKPPQQMENVLDGSVGPHTHIDKKGQLPNPYVHGYIQSPRDASDLNLRLLGTKYESVDNPSASLSHLIPDMKDGVLSAVNIEKPMELPQHDSNSHLETVPSPANSVISNLIKSDFNQNKACGSVSLSGKGDIELSSSVDSSKAKTTDDISANLNQAALLSYNLDKEYVTGFSASKVIPTTSLNKLTEDAKKLDGIFSQTSGKEVSNELTNNSCLNISDGEKENKSSANGNSLCNPSLNGDSDNNHKAHSQKMETNKAKGNGGSVISSLVSRNSALGAEFLDTKELIQTLNKRLLAESVDASASSEEKCDERNSSTSTSSSASSLKKVHFVAQTTQVDYNTCDSPLTMSTIIRESKRLKEEALKLCAAGDLTTDGSESEGMAGGHFDGETLGAERKVSDDSLDKLDLKSSMSEDSTPVVSEDKRSDASLDKLTMKSQLTGDDTTVVGNVQSDSSHAKSSVTDISTPNVLVKKESSDFSRIKHDEKLDKNNPQTQQISNGTFLKGKADKNMSACVNNDTAEMVPVKDSTYTCERLPGVGADNASVVISDKISEKPQEIPVSKESGSVSQRASTLPVASGPIDPFILNRPVIHVVKKFNSPIRKEKLNHAVLNVGFTPIHPQPVSSVQTHALTTPAIITKTVMASSASAMTVLHVSSASTDVELTCGTVTTGVSARDHPSHVEMQKIDSVLHTIKPTPDRSDTSVNIDNTIHSIKPSAERNSSSTDMTSVPGASASSNTTRENIRPERDLTLRVREPVTGSRETLDDLIACHEEQLSNITTLCRQEMALLLRVKTGEVDLPSYTSCLQDLLTTKINALSALGTRLQQLSPGHPPNSSTDQSS